MPEYNEYNKHSAIERLFELVDQHFSAAQLNYMLSDSIDEGGEWPDGLGECCENFSIDAVRVLNRIGMDAAE